MTEKEEKSTGWVLVGIIFSISVLVFLISSANTDQKETIGRYLCENNSLIYDKYVGNTILCRTNQTYINEHYNITPPSFEIQIKVDWEYYLNKEDG